ncbi:MAG: hypothetical protein EHM43_08675 [Ignavibacteriae bacterium]|nr:MAG: hypothetical protein EHM43_08675 [Ignavibacteriota bacterium]
MNTPLTLEDRLALAERMDDLMDEVDAGWSVPVMEGFFMALALAPEPPDVSAWIGEAVPTASLTPEEATSLTSLVMQLHTDVHDFLHNEDSEWVPLFAHTEPMDTALTALGFVQGMEHFAKVQWKMFTKEHAKTASTIRTVADYALEDGKVSADQFEIAEKKFMECVFEVVAFG